jgi:hypothetical protein
MSFKPLEQPAIRKTAAKIIERSLCTGDTIFTFSNFPFTALEKLREQVQQTWKTGNEGRERPLVNGLRGQTFELPWSDEHPARTLWNRYVEMVGLSGMRKDVEQAFGVELYDGLALQELTGESFLSAVLAAIVDPYEHATSGLTVDPEALLLAFLTDTCSTSELRKLGLPRNLTTEDCFRLLRFILKCQKGVPPGQDLAMHTRLWLVFNGAERLLTYSPKERSLLSNGLITLLSVGSTFITCWLNISHPLLDEGEIAEITDAYGTKIWQYLDYKLIDAPAEKITAAEIIDYVVEE